MAVTETKDDATVLKDDVAGTEENTRSEDRAESGNDGGGLGTQDTKKDDAGDVDIKPGSIYVPSQFSQGVSDVIGKEGKYAKYREMDFPTQEEMWKENEDQIKEQYGDEAEEVFEQLYKIKADEYQANVRKAEEEIQLQEIEGFWNLFTDKEDLEANTNVVLQTNSGALDYLGSWSTEQWSVRDASVRKKIVEIDGEMVEVPEGQSLVSMIDNPEFTKEGAAIKGWQYSGGDKYGRGDAHMIALREGDKVQGEIMSRYDDENHSLNFLLGGNDLKTNALKIPIQTTANFVVDFIDTFNQAAGFTAGALTGEMPEWMTDNSTKLAGFKSTKSDYDQEHMMSINNMIDMGVNVALQLAMMAGTGGLGNMVALPFTNPATASKLAGHFSMGIMGMMSAKDVGNEALNAGFTPRQAAAIYFTSIAGLAQANRLSGGKGLEELQRGAASTIAAKKTLTKELAEGAAKSQSGFIGALNKINKTIKNTYHLPSKTIGKINDSVQVVDDFAAKLAKGGKSSAVAAGMAKIVASGSREAVEELTELAVQEVINHSSSALSVVFGEGKEPPKLRTMWDDGYWEDLGVEALMSALGGFMGGNIAGAKTIKRTFQGKADQVPDSDLPFDGPGGAGMATVSFNVARNKKNALKDEAAYWKEIDRLHKSGALGSHKISNMKSQDGSRFLTMKELPRGYDTAKYGSMADMNLQALQIQYSILTARFQNSTKEFDKVVEEHPEMIDLIKDDHMTNMVQNALSKKNDILKELGLSNLNVDEKLDDLIKVQRERLDTIASDASQRSRKLADTRKEMQTRENDFRDKVKDNTQKQADLKAKYQESIRSKNIDHKYSAADELLVNVEGENIPEGELRNKANKIINDLLTNAETSEGIAIALESEGIHLSDYEFFGKDVSKQYYGLSDFDITPELEFLRDERAALDAEFSQGAVSDLLSKEQKDAEKEAAAAVQDHEDKVAQEYKDFATALDIKEGNIKDLVDSHILVTDIASGRIMEKLVIESQLKKEQYAILSEKTPEAFKKYDELVYKLIQAESKYYSESMDEYNHALARVKEDSDFVKSMKSVQELNFALNKGNKFEYLDTGAKQSILKVIDEKIDVDRHTVDALSIMLDGGKGSKGKTIRNIIKSVLSEDDFNTLNKHIEDGNLNGIKEIGNTLQEQLKEVTIELENIFLSDDLSVAEADVYLEKYGQLLLVHKLLRKDLGSIKTIEDVKELSFNIDSRLAFNKVTLDTETFMQNPEFDFVSIEGDVEGNTVTDQGFTLDEGTQNAVELRQVIQKAKDPSLITEKQTTASPFVHGLSLHSASQIKVNPDITYHGMAIELEERLKDGTADKADVEVLIEELKMRSAYIGFLSTSYTALGSVRAVNKETFPDGFDRLSNNTMFSEFLGDNFVDPLLVSQAALKKRKGESLTNEESNTLDKYESLFGRRDVMPETLKFNGKTYVDENPEEDEELFSRQILGDVAIYATDHNLTDLDVLQYTFSDGTIMAPTPQTIGTDLAMIKESHPELYTVLYKLSTKDYNIAYLFAASTKNTVVAGTYINTVLNRLETAVENIDDLDFLMKEYTSEKIKYASGTIEAFQAGLIRLSTSFEGSDTVKDELEALRELADKTIVSSDPESVKEAYIVIKEIRERLFKLEDKDKLLDHIEEALSANVMSGLSGSAGSMRNPEYYTAISLALMSDLSLIDSSIKRYVEDMLPEGEKTEENVENLLLPIMEQIDVVEALASTAFPELLKRQKNIRGMSDAETHVPAMIVQGSQGTGKTKVILSMGVKIAQDILKKKYGDTGTKVLLASNNKRHIDNLHKAASKSAIELTTLDGNPKSELNDLYKMFVKVDPTSKDIVYKYADKTELYKEVNDKLSDVGYIVYDEIGDVEYDANNTKDTKIKDKGVLNVILEGLQEVNKLRESEGKPPITMVMAGDAKQGLFHDGMKSPRTPNADGVWKGDPKSPFDMGFFEPPRLTRQFRFNIKEIGEVGTAFSDAANSTNLSAMNPEKAISFVKDIKFKSGIIAETNTVGGARNYQDWASISDTDNDIISSIRTHLSNLDNNPDFSVLIVSDEAVSSDSVLGKLMKEYEGKTNGNGDPIFETESLDKIKGSEASFVLANVPKNFIKDVETEVKNKHIKQKMLTLSMLIGRATEFSAITVPNYSWENDNTIDIKPLKTPSSAKAKLAWSDALVNQVLGPYDSGNTEINKETPVKEDGKEDGKEPEVVVTEDLSFDPIIDGRYSKERAAMIKRNAEVTMKATIDIDDLVQGVFESGQGRVSKYVPGGTNAEGTVKLKADDMITISDDSGVEPDVEVSLGEFINRGYTLNKESYESWTPPKKRKGKQSPAVKLVQHTFDYDNVGLKMGVPEVSITIDVSDTTRDTLESLNIQSFSELSSFIEGLKSKLNELDSESQKKEIQAITREIHRLEAIKNREIDESIDIYQKPDMYKSVLSDLEMVKAEKLKAIEKLEADIENTVKGGDNDANRAILDIMNRELNKLNQELNAIEAELKSKTDEYNSVLDDILTTEDGDEELEVIPDSEDDSVSREDFIKVATEYDSNGVALAYTQNNPETGNRDLSESLYGAAAGASSVLGNKHSYLHDKVAIQYHITNAIGRGPDGPDAITNGTYSYKLVAYPFTVTNKVVDENGVERPVTTTGYNVALMASHKDSNDRWVRVATFNNLDKLPQDSGTVKLLKPLVDAVKGASMDTLPPTATLTENRKWISGIKNDRVVHLPISNPGAFITGATSGGLVTKSNDGAKILKSKGIDPNIEVLPLKQAQQLWDITGSTTRTEGTSTVKYSKPFIQRVGSKTERGRAYVIASTANNKFAQDLENLEESQISALIEKIQKGKEDAKRKGLPPSTGTDGLMLIELRTPRKSFKELKELYDKEIGNDNLSIKEEIRSHIQPSITSYRLINAFGTLHKHLIGTNETIEDLLENTKESIDERSDTIKDVMDEDSIKAWVDSLTPDQKAYMRSVVRFLFNPENMGFVMVQQMGGTFYDAIEGIDPSVPDSLETALDVINTLPVDQRMGVKTIDDLKSLAPSPFRGGSERNDVAGLVTTVKGNINTPAIAGDKSNNVIIKYINSKLLRSLSGNEAMRMDPNKFDMVKFFNVTRVVNSSIGEVEATDVIDNFISNIPGMTGGINVSSHLSHKSKEDFIIVTDGTEFESNIQQIQQPAVTFNLLGTTLESLSGVRPVRKKSIGDGINYKQGLLDFKKGLDAFKNSDVEGVKAYGAKAVKKVSDYITKLKTAKATRTKVQAALKFKDNLEKAVANKLKLNKVVSIDVRSKPLDKIFPAELFSEGGPLEGAENIKSAMYNSAMHEKTVNLIEDVLNQFVSTSDNEDLKASIDKTLKGIKKHMKGVKKNVRSAASTRRSIIKAGAVTISDAMSPLLGRASEKFTAEISALRDDINTKLDNFGSYTENNLPYDDLMVILSSPLTLQATKNAINSVLDIDPESTERKTIIDMLLAVKSGQLDVLDSLPEGFVGEHISEAEIANVENIMTELLASDVEVIEATFKTALWKLLSDTSLSEDSKLAQISALKTSFDENFIIEDESLQRLSKDMGDAGDRIKTKIEDDMKNETSSELLTNNISTLSSMSVDAQAAWNTIVTKVLDTNYENVNFQQLVDEINAGKGLSLDSELIEADLMLAVSESKLSDDIEDEISDAISEWRSECK